MTTKPAYQLHPITPGVEDPCIYIPPQRFPLVNNCSSMPADCGAAVCTCCRLHVHVIGGLNGSGKSVVLSAMQAALGAKVKDTGRGDNIKDLVKDGCNQASVKVSRCWAVAKAAWVSRVIVVMLATMMLATNRQ